MKDIKTMIESMSAKDIKLLMASLGNRVRNSVDTSYRERRIAKTELFFACKPIGYNEHDECIREQVLSGVDL
jgi:hypothetical protein